MKAFAITLVGMVMLTLGTGCGAASLQEPQTSSQPVRWETRVLANGVELRVSEDASPDAVRVAEDIQAEMRSRYINAR